MEEIVNHYIAYLISIGKPVPNNLTYKNYPAKLKEKFTALKQRRVNGGNIPRRLLGGLKCICNCKYERVL